MTHHEKFRLKILDARSDANIPFQALRLFLQHLGFSERIKGSHHIYWKDGIEEILNLQARGSLAKPYQVRQIRAILLRYKL